MSDIPPFQWTDKLSQILGRINLIIAKVTDLDAVTSTLQAQTINGLSNLSNTIDHLTTRVAGNEQRVTNLEYRVDELSQYAHIKIVPQLADLPTPSFYPLVYSYGEGNENEGLFVRMPDGRYKAVGVSGRVIRI